MDRTRVKICGLTTIDEAHAAVASGADMIGLVFAESPRQVTPEFAVTLTNELPAHITTCGVFRRATEHDAMAIWRIAQFHCLQCDAGSWKPVTGTSSVALPRVIQVHRVGATNVESIIKCTDDGRVFVLEGEKSGVGARVDWTVAARIASEAFCILAGGLTPDNVAQAIRTVRPYGVDVSSGVESSPGKKDPIKIRDFLQAVRDVDRELQ